MFYKISPRNLLGEIFKHFSLFLSVLRYKTLWTRNLHQMDISCSKLVSFLLSVTNTLAGTNTVAF
jgi:hypothetical protein